MMALPAGAVTGITPAPRSGFAPELRETLVDVYEITTEAVRRSEGGRQSSREARERYNHTRERLEPSYLA